MGSRRSKGLGTAALVLAGSLAAGSANAVPITLYANVDFGADRAAASPRVGDSSDVMPASREVALGLAPQQTDLSIAPLAVSFRRWDESLLVTTSDVAVTPVDPGRLPVGSSR